MNNPSAESFVDDIYERTNETDFECDVVSELGVADVTRLLSQTILVGHGVPTGDREDPQARQAPRGCDHQEGSLLRPSSQIFERRGDGPVAVQAQDEQVEDGGCAGHVVG